MGRFSILILPLILPILPLDTLGMMVLNTTMFFAKTDIKMLALQMSFENRH